MSNPDQVRYGEKVYVSGPEGIHGGVLEYLTKFVDVRLQEVEVDGMNLFENMEPVGVKLQGDPNLVPDQIMMAFSKSLDQVILTMNKDVLEKTEDLHLSPSLLQNAAAGAATIGVAHVLEQRQGRILSTKEQQAVCQSEVERIGVMMRVLAEKHDVTGEFLHGEDLLSLD